MNFLCRLQNLARKLFRRQQKVVKESRGYQSRKAQLFFSFRPVKRHGINEEENVKEVEMKRKTSRQLTSWGHITPIKALRTEPLVDKKRRSTGVYAEYEDDAPGGKVVGF